MCQGLTTASGRNRSSVAGPIPGTLTRSSSSTKGWCSTRHRTIALARFGPIPGSASSSAWDARFKSSFLRESLDSDTSSGFRRRAAPVADRLGRLTWGAKRPTVLLPRPGTRSRSERWRNCPLSWRSRTIARASPGPMPGSRSSWTSLARFGSIRSPRVSGWRRRSARLRISPAAASAESTSPAASRPAAVSSVSV